MFTDLQDLLQNTDISTIQLHASDYELALKQLLTIYGDRALDSSYMRSGIPWDNGRKARNAKHCQSSLRRRSGLTPCAASDPRTLGNSSMRETLKTALPRNGLSRYKDSPVFYWNNGYQNLVALELVEEKLEYSIAENKEHFDTPLALIQENKLSPGLYIFDNLLDLDRLCAQEKSIRESQIYNCASRLEHQSGVKVILLGEWIQLSPKLRLKLKQVKLGLPKASEIEQVLQNKLGCQPDTKLISACQGLAWGDIHHELEQSNSSKAIAELTDKFLKVKEAKLNNSELNLEYFSKPEISSAGGNENLSEFLQKLVKLNEPTALRYGIKPPRAMLFVGPPGTGKSLRAKMIARDLGYTLLGISFGDILGSDNPDRAVSQLLGTCW